jgi:hypothetical protein
LSAAGARPGATFEDLNRVLTAFAAVLTEALKRFVSEFNIYDLISHPYRDGASEGDWWRSFSPRS